MGSVLFLLSLALSSMTGVDSLAIIWVIGIAIIFITAGMKCLLCSTAWHLLAGCATSHWHRGAACVDYVGLSGLIAASVIGMEVSLAFSVAFILCRF